MWRPKNWISEISFEELTKIEPCLVSMMTIKEKKLYEAGADAILKALEDTKSLPFVAGIIFGKYEKGNNQCKGDDYRRGWKDCRKYYNIVEIKE